MDNEAAADKAQVARWVWLAYQGLASFHLLALIALMSVWLFYAVRQDVDVHKYIPYVQFLLSMTLLMACIGAVTRRSWGPHWVRVTAVWHLAVYWWGVQGVVHRAVNEILYGPAIVIGGGLDLSRMPYPTYVYLIARVVGLSLLLALIMTSHVVSRYQGGGTVGRKKSVWIERGGLFYMGILLIFLGLAFKWVDWHVERQTYGITIGSYLVAAGVVLILIWHILARELFIAGSVASVSAILFVHTFVMSPAYLNVMLWLPVVGLGVLSLFGTKLRVKSRVVVLCLPVVFMLIFLGISVVEIPLIMCFGRYHKETSRRPPDFPQYMQAPAGAANVRYRGGDRPYLSFTIEDPYPATKTLDFMLSNINQAGWRKLEYSLVNPQRKSSHLTGWYNALTRWPGPPDEDSEARAKLKSRLWTADWINEKNESLSIDLEYRPAEVIEGDLQTLHCNLYKRPPDPLHLRFIEHYRRIHPHGDEPNEAEESSEQSEFF